ncbi:MAG: nuclease-related domain-containing protein [Steroidobacteraceae bacterium]
MNHLPATPVLVALVLGGVVLGLAVSWAWRWWRLRRARRRLVLAIASAGFEHLEDVLVPDGSGGTYHVDFLVLTARGVLVVDLRDVAGNIFGGDQMTDWTVMNGPARHTFANPQGALYDRIAAVKAITGEVPVEGRIVFTRRARFPKGLPKWTVPVDGLRADFPPADRGLFESALMHYRAGWTALRTAALPSPLGKPRPI